MRLIFILEVREQHQCQVLSKKTIEHNIQTSRSKLGLRQYPRERAQGHCGRELTKSLAYEVAGGDAAARCSSSPGGTGAQAFAASNAEPTKP